MSAFFMQPSRVVTVVAPPQCERVCQTCYLKAPAMLGTFSETGWSRSCSPPIQSRCRVSIRCDSAQPRIRITQLCLHLILHSGGCDPVYSLSSQQQA